MSPLDVAFLCMEHGGAPMHVGGLIVIDPVRPVGPDEVVAVLAERAAAIPQLRQRVHSSARAGGGASWVPDPVIDWGWHIRAHQLAAPADRDALHELIAKLMAVPLHPSRPLWQAHVISGQTDGSVAVLMKLHHALADGATAMLLGLGLLDQGATRRHLRPARTPSTRTPAQPTVAGGLLGSVVDRAVGAVNATPSVIDKARHTALLTGDMIRGLRRPASPLPGGHSRNRCLATVTMPLAKVKRARAAHGGTVNDVLLAVLAGALRASLGKHCSGSRVRALIPVSLRGRTRPDASRASGNQLSGYLCDLPTDLADPRQRLRAVRAAMDANKSAGPLRGPGAIPLLANQIPSVAHRAIAPLACLGAPLLFDTVITTVPVPSLPLTLQGAPLVEIYPIVPLAPGHGLTVGLLTYQDNVHISLFADANTDIDLSRLAEAIPVSLAELIPRPPDEVPAQCRPLHEPATNFTRTPL